METITKRVGPVVVRVQVETLDSRIDFADILQAVKVKPDDYCDAPWENCDGYTHTLRPADQFDYPSRPDEMQGYCYHDSRRKVIELPKGEDYGLFAYHRARGASRQVAAELVSQERARTIDQLRRWYENGWQCWQVSCDYLGAYDSLSGVYDDEGDYVEDVKREVAANVAAELETQGFEVFGKPEEKPRLTGRPAYPVRTPDGMRTEHYTRSLSAENWRAEFKRNLNSQNRA